MRFPFDIYLLALIASGSTTFLTVPFWRAWCLRTGLVDAPGARKIHSEPIPLAGGLAVITGLIFPLIAGVVLMKAGGFDAAIYPALMHGLARRASQLGAILVGAAATVFLGWMDDKYELRPITKLGSQVLVALVLASTGVRITLFVPSLIFSFGITILWMVTVMNALNFMDNMNGLCSGLGIIGSFLFAAISGADGQYLVTLIALSACGALLGFLPFNFPRARAFLGDAGSHLVGYLLGVLAILPHFYSKQNPEALAVLKPLLVLAVPLGDLFWVVILRWRQGQPFYIGDNNHLSHRLVRRGFSQVRAVLMVWLLAAAIGALALL